MKTIIKSGITALLLVLICSGCATTQDKKLVEAIPNLVFAPLQDDSKIVYCTVSYYRKEAIWPKLIDELKKYYEETFQKDNTLKDIEDIDWNRYLSVQFTSLPNGHLKIEYESALEIDYKYNVEKTIVSSKSNNWKVNAAISSDKRKRTIILEKPTTIIENNNT